jgi:serine/threonine-protein kinase
MTTALPPTRNSTLPPDVALRLDQVCDRFKAAWDAGTPPRLEDYLGDVPEPERPALLRELIPLDVHLRKKQGEKPTAQEYQARFPQVALGWLARELGEAGPAQAGRYQLFEEIGRGGMGEVRKCYDPLVDRDQAIKLLREQLLDQPELVRRFLEEGRINGRLQHPGIVPVYDLGELPDRRPFFTMKLVEGRTLAALLKERTAPGQDLPRFLTIFEQICQTVAYTHSHEVIHRDLKPANVMVGAFGEVQVMDWGLAKVLDRDRGNGAAASAPAGERLAGGSSPEDTPADLPTQEGQWMGTAPYVPPEQARGEVGRVDQRSDVFGLGAILCEILTGQPPFTGKNLTEVLAKARACDHAEALARLDGCGADADLVRLAKACLAPQPEDRPGDAGLVAQEVAAYLAGVQERLRATELERAAAEARAQEAQATAAAERRATELERAAAEEAKATAAAERRARRRTRALAVAIVAMVTGAGLGGLWVQQLRGERQAENQRQRLAFEADLDRLATLRQQERWAEARAVLERTGQRLGADGPEDFRQQLEQASADLDLVDRLEGIRLKRSMWVEGKWDTRTAEQDYASVFRATGLGQEGDEPATVAARLRASAVAGKLVAALDDWANITRDPKRRAWLLAVARRADGNAGRDRFRDPEAWADRARLQDLATELLADEAKLAGLPPPLVDSLGDRLREMGGEAVPLLKAGQSRWPKDFWLNFNLAIALRKEKNWAEAEGYYRVAVALRPEAAAAHNDLGTLLLDLKRPQEALAAFHKAIEIDPKFAYAHNNLGTLLLDLKRPQEALAAFHKAIEIDPKYAIAYNNLGLALRDLKRPQEALEACRKAIEIDPKLAEAYNNLGLVLAELKRPQEALDAYHKALDIAPKLAEAHTGLGNVLRDLKRPQEALDAFHKALAIDPKLAYAYHGLGYALFDLQRLEDAILAHQKALEIDPKLADAHNGLGNVQWKLKRPAEAIKEYNKALEIDPRHADAHNGLGNALRDLNRPEEALKEYRKALEIDPDLALSHNGMGNAFRDLRRPQEALKEYRKALEIDPAFALGHYTLGNALRDLNRLEEAVEEYRKALKIDPKFAQAHNNLGLALHDLKGPEKAIPEYRKALAIDPKLAPAHYNLGNALRDLKRLGEAVEEYRKALAIDPQDAETLCNLGGVLQEQGKFTEALDSLRMGDAIGSKQSGWSYPSAQWVRAAERLVELDRRLTALLERKEQPANETESLALAELSQKPFKRCYATCARLYSDAFANNAKLADDLQQQHRFNAARSAALAAAGQGEDVRMLPDRDAQRLRQQALDWLKADLAAYAKRAAGNDAVAKQLVRQRLTHWQQDQDFVSVREAKALAQLSEPERQAWRQLWDDVADLLQRVQEK